MAETGVREFQNVELLDLIHAIERARLLRSADARPTVGALVAQ